MPLRYLKPLVFVLCLVPLAYTLWRLPAAVNPIEWLTHQSGTWALRLLCITLLMTPLRKLGGWVWPIRLRRMLGLYAFFYALVHVLIYAGFDHQFDLAEIAHDVIQHPYVLAGMTAFALMTPLAVTSTDAMMRRLGRRWGQLHRLVYLVAIAGVVHYLWLVKRDLTQPLIYAALVSVLLGARVWWRWRR
ncbi:sulfite oxidase heme-binding subunit YedZ [Chitinibacteraceae bacterium HSL-7]